MTHFFLRVLSFLDVVIETYVQERPTPGQLTQLISCLLASLQHEVPGHQQWGYCHLSISICFIFIFTFQIAFKLTRLHIFYVPTGHTHGKSGFNFKCVNFKCTIVIDVLNNSSEICMNCHESHDSKRNTSSMQYTMIEINVGFTSNECNRTQLMIINIGLGAIINKPLSEPMFTQISASMWRHLTDDTCHCNAHLTHLHLVPHISVSESGRHWLR